MLCSFFSIAHSADIYSIQIGTYKKYAPEIKTAVNAHDDVHVFTYKNKSRITIGEFSSKNQAQPLLSQLISEGYKDAFIRKTGQVDISRNPSVIEKFNILISEMDARAFYLDGEMYIFQGKGYIKIHHSKPKALSSLDTSSSLNLNNFQSRKIY